MNNDSILIKIFYEKTQPEFDNSFKNIKTYDLKKIANKLTKIKLDQQIYSTLENSDMNSYNSILD